MHLPFYFDYVIPRPGNPLSNYQTQTAMKTIILAIIAFFLTNYLCQGQAKFEKEIQDVKKILIESIPGTILLKQSTNNILRIESDKINNNKPPIEDERAKGLKPLNSNFDNTGLGLGLVKSGNNITISGNSLFGKEKDGNYTIYLPAQTDISVNYASPFSGDLVKIEDLSNPIEVKTLAADISFANITGPAVFHSISGNIEGVFGTVNQEAPSSFTCVSGFIDIALPSSTGIDVNLKSISGKIYSGFDIKRKEETVNKDKKASGMNQIGGMIQQTEGLINEGGVKLSLLSISGNIYIRQK
jgi:lia operon protein LiaG